MNRNTRAFDSNPVNIDISRSTFYRNSSVKTSFHVGQVVPFYVDEVLPGDTFNIKTSKIVRLQTLITPIMDNVYLDTYYFFVPNRLVWKHWKEFNGENTAGPWAQEVQYEIPQITSPVGGWSNGSIADQMGIPTFIEGLSVNALPFRAYALIINEWFRDQNLQQPVNINFGDETVQGSNGTDYVIDMEKGGRPFFASKYRDYFTSCLPEPQKGPDVTIGLAGNAPVLGNGSALMTNAGDLATFYHAGSDKNMVVASQNGIYPLKIVETGDSGMSADLSDASAITINNLRMAFQIQKLYEKDARGGSRYIEIIKSHFGVTSPDARQQRPEYLGGNRIPLHINQVVQTVQQDDSPLGETGAYSVTSDYNSDFTKSFTEHGILLGLMVARYDHTYQQGIERLWSRKDRFDYYWPVFSNIGEQAVKNKEIYAQGNAQDEEVFGYQEAWAEYRYKPSRVANQMRSNALNNGGSLDIWHLADNYKSLPYLSSEWIQEDYKNVDRCLAVTSSISNQLFADVYIENKTTRPMPMHSIPGLIDHH